MSSPGSFQNLTAEEQLKIYKAELEAIGKSQGVIEFNMDGTIITANDNFLNAMGYRLDEIQGRHHSLFVEPQYKNSSEYKAFWAKLNRGEYDSHEYKRRGKGGKEVWIQASYNPILDLNGRPFKVVKYATDVTEQKLQSADFAGQIKAIDMSQAVIEFNMDGTIITANENFLNAMGYRLDEVQGRHHSLFVEPRYRDSAEYRQFWAKLNRGEYDVHEYKRLGKGGKEVWIRASYNPILDLNGRPFKVVKYATDVTEQKLQNADFAGQIKAIDMSQAVIEFNMDGTIITANDNFLNVMGYRLDEVQGRHHSLFVEPQHRDSAEYRQFWAKLNQGEYEAHEYKRLGKGGKEVWIQASYNPILDLNGKPFKVVKYATDVTEQMNALKQIDKLVQSAIAGQLQNRIDTSQSKGFTASLGDGINQLLEAVTVPVSASARLMEAIANGNLSQSMSGEFQGEFKTLSNAINSSVANLRSMVDEIRCVSRSVFSASRKIAQGNTDLSQRTEEQADSLQKTTSAIEALTDTVQKNSENATEATKKSSSAMQKATAGSEVISNAVAAMEAIDKSSKQIADIIGVIDEIAFQTNLLALNAAVEAARAGEQGRGFAVVAAEVRSLAGRSASAAKEIKALINDSVETVGEGTRLVDETGRTFTELAEAVDEVVSMISDIDIASQEQAQGINEVRQAVSVMEKMREKNVALVEDVMSSSKAMEQQAQTLLNQVGSFNTGNQ
ncbi:PAS domain S-box protein [Exilibacterium tricleocarpae]|uniref:PAS domain S-box protein n=1 Tax=Exilibacterium tricleocarpae TaxID=2591008 RepID=A0A545TS77_9GAMM|nr:methyl-accepting chemotaxis protein [Exilibacterium tricleocarpae]TQV80077.1 PAS domain S-box protein [Exilibacterium tricleocarpae]